MNRKELLIQGWDNALENEGWYPPLGAALEGVDAAKAVWRPVGEAANTIWETVNHLTVYKEIVYKRLLGQEAPYPGSNDDTFIVGEGEEAWRQAVERLYRVHREIRGLLDGYGEKELDSELSSQTVGEFIHNLILHDAFHTGQIILVRKLQGSWPSQRSFS